VKEGADLALRVFELLPTLCEITETSKNGC
jgi:hypothetical protein